MHLVGTEAADTGREPPFLASMFFSSLPPPGPCGGKCYARVMYTADIGRCSVLYSAGALRLMVFRLPRAGGQSCSGVALCHPRAVLSSLFCTLLRGAFAFFCARFARCECLENHAGRGFQGSGLAPVSVLRFACTETGAGSHRAQRESTSRAAVLADCMRVNAWRHSPAAQSCCALM